MSCPLSDDIPHDSDFCDIAYPNQHEASFSDDVEAQEVQQRDLTAEKNRLGVVIQHRSWSLLESFRSDDDRAFGMLYRHS